MRKVVFNRRITIFLTDIVPCSNEIRRKIAAAWPSACIAPNIYIAPQPILGAPLMEENGPWVLREDMTMGREFIGVENNRIDFISNVTSKDESKCAERCLNRLLFVLKTLDRHDIIRVAYHPSTAIEDITDVQDYFDNLVKLPTYEGSNPIGVHVMFTYKTKKAILERELLVNVTSRISQGTKTERDGNKAVNTSVIPIVDNDINTEELKEGALSEEEVRDFILKAVGWNNTLIDNYVKA